MLRLCQFVLLSAALTGVPQTPPSQNPAQKNPPQNSTPDRRDPALGAKGSTVDSKETDGYLATWLVVDNNNEIELAKLAQQKATNPEVKAFAQKLIADHGAIVQQLQPFASGTAMTTGSLEGSEPTKGPSQAESASFAHEGAFDHIGLIQDLGKQCLQSARAELEKKQGAEFDRCFMGMAIGGHMHANDMLTVFQSRASSSLKPILSEGQKVVTEHLQHAKDIAKRMEDKATASPTDRKQP